METRDAVNIESVSNNTGLLQYITVDKQTFSGILGFP